MSQKLSHALVYSILATTLLPLLVITRQAGGQPTAVKPQMPNEAYHPVSLAHLYWHFLTYQNHLDSKAAEVSSHGKDGAGMRKMLQQGLGFNDSDYAPIHISSARLTAEIKALDARATAIRADGPLASNQKAMMALTVEREADINSEIYYLRRTLTPEQVIIFESFLVKLFSPSNAISHLPHPNGHPVEPAVAQ